MRKSEVIRLIGKDRWKAFEKFMVGQTVGYQDGQTDYYEWDVKRFINKEKSGQEFFD